MFPSKYECGMNFLQEDNLHSKCSDQNDYYISGVVGKWNTKFGYYCISYQLHNNTLLAQIRFRGRVEVGRSS